MDKSSTGADRRLARLERVLAGRRARLAATIARQQARPVRPRPVAALQRYGYPVALLLAAAAILPTVVAFAARRPTREVVRADTHGTPWLRALLDTLRSVEDER